MIDHAREKEIDKLQLLTQQAAKDNIEQIINEPVYELNLDFWEEIRVKYLQELRDISTNCEYILSSGFKCDKDEIY